MLSSVVIWCGSLVLMCRDRYSTGEEHVEEKRQSFTKIAKKPQKALSNSVCLNVMQNISNWILKFSPNVKVPLCAEVCLCSSSCKKEASAIAVKNTNIYIHGAENKEII